MARKVVKVENHHSKLGMLMTALAALGAFGFFKNRGRRSGGIKAVMNKLVSAAATVVAAREVFKERSSGHRAGRFGAWLAR